MSRELDDLTAPFYPKACELIARVTARGIAVLVVDTLRTFAEHQRNLATGASHTTRSKHLPRMLRGWPADDPDAQKSDAIDLAPYDVYQLHGPDKLKWDPTDPAWAVIGEEAERLGLRWGGRWQSPHDPGHAELILTPPVIT